MRAYAGLIAVAVAGSSCGGEKQSPEKQAPAATATTVPSSGSSVALDAGTSAMPPVPKHAVPGAELLLRKAEAQTDQRIRFRMSAGILHQLEGGRVPDRVRGALAIVSDRRSVMKHRVRAVWDALSRSRDVLAAWRSTCDSGPFDEGGHIVALAMNGGMSARERTASIFGKCQLQRAGLITREQLSTDYDALVLAHAVHAYLESRGTLLPVEIQALAMLARGSAKAVPPFREDELGRVDEYTRVSVGVEQAVQRRVADGLMLLKAGELNRFFGELVHPHELSGIPVEEAVRVFSKKGKGKVLREALELGKGRAVRDDGDGEASVPLPWSPQRDAKRRLRFQLHKGKWYLRL